MSLISLVATVIFGFLSVYFFLKSRRSKQLACTYTSATLQSKAHPDVDITFRNRPIENLSQVLVCLWNSGTSELRTGDLPPDTHPKLTLASSRVLSVRVLAVSKTHIGFRAEQIGDEAVHFEFAYLNPSDGGIIEVLFERLAGTRGLPEFSAPIIGGRAPALRQFGPVNVLSRIYVVVTSSLMVGGSAWIGAFALTRPYYEPRYGLMFLVAVLGFLFGVTGMAVVLREWRDARLPGFASKYFQRRGLTPRWSRRRR